MGEGTEQNARAGFHKKSMKPVINEEGRVSYD